MKKNNKGFTLVELLAVVVILAIIALVTIPAVNRYIMNSKEQAYVTAEKSMESAAKNFVTECEGYIYDGTDSNPLGYCTSYPISNNKNKPTLISLEELIGFGYIDPIQDPGKKDTQCDSHNSYVALYRDSNGINATLHVTVILVCPSREEKDENDNVINHGNSVDENFNIVVTSKVEKDTGTVNYEYGNWVKDPIVVTLSQRSHPENKVTYYYKTGGDWVEISGSQIRIEGTTNADYDFKGVYTDDTGRVFESLPVTRSYRIDKTPPVPISTEKGAIVLNGNLNPGATDVFISPVDVSCGVGDPDSKLKSCKVSLQEGSEGSVRVTAIEERLGYTAYLVAEDYMGNVYRTSKTFGIDKTNPVFSGISSSTDDGSNYVSGTWTNQTVKIRGNASDNLGVYNIIYDSSVDGATELDSGSYYEISDTKNTTITIHAEDKAKNKSANETIDVKVDKIIPVIDDVEGLGVESYGKNQVITIVASDDGGSNISATAGYSFDNGATWQASPSKAFTANGTYILKVKDTAGNISEGRTINVGKIDNEGPVIDSITGNPTDWTKQTTLTVTAHDDGALLHNEPYSYDNGATWSKFNTAIFSSNQTVVVKVRDKLGNISSQNVVLTKLDSNAPTVSLSGHNTDYSLNKTITITANDNLSGLHDTPYSWDNGSTWVRENTRNFTDNVTVNVKVRDKVGNISNTVSAKIEKIDTTGPNVTVGGNPSSPAKSAPLVINASDTGSGLHATPYSWDGGATWVASNEKTFTSNGTVNIQVRDALSNVTSKTITISNVDTSSPNVTVTGNPGSWTQSATLVINASDVGVAGLHATPYSWDGGNNWTSAASRVFTSNTSFVVKVRDKLGNASSYNVSITKVDGTVPTVGITARKMTSGTAVSSGTWSGEGLNFVLTYGTVGSSGATIKYCKDTANTCTPSTTISSGSVITNYNSVGGTYYIRYMITSGTGKSSGIGSFTARVDKNPPSITNITLTGNKVTPPTISVSCSDAEIGGATGSGTCTNAGVCTATCRDAAGNTSQQTKTYTNSAHSSCGSYNSGTYDTCNWTPRCPDEGSCYDVHDENGNRTMTCCTCPKTANYSCWH